MAHFRQCTVRRAMRVGLLAVAGVIAAQWVAHATSTPGNQFARTAAAAGIAEVQLGKEAVKKAQDPAVKTFAETMVRDHTNANTELQSIAAEQHIQLPKGPTAEQKKASAKINKQSGRSFDQAYMQQMVRDHEDAVALFEKAASNNDDPQLRAFAEKTLPTLKHHLEEAQSIDRQVSAGRPQTGEAMGRAGNPKVGVQAPYGSNVGSDTGAVGNRRGAAGDAPKPREAAPSGTYD